MIIKLTDRIKKGPYFTPPQVGGRICPYCVYICSTQSPNIDWYIHVSPQGMPDFIYGQIGNSFTIEWCTSWDTNTPERLQAKRIYESWKCKLH